MAVLADNCTDPSGQISLDFSSRVVASHDMSILQTLKSLLTSAASFVSTWGKVDSPFHQMEKSRFWKMEMGKNFREHILYSLMENSTPSLTRGG